MRPADRPWPARTRKRRLATVLIGLLLIVGVVAFSVRAGPRSFAVQVVTRGLEIVFDGSAMNAWRLEGVTVCFRNDARVSGASPLPNHPSGCDPRLFAIETYDALELVWGDGNLVQIARLGPDAPLEIQLLGVSAAPTQVGEQTLTVNSRILVSDAAWREGSTLTMSGQATLGKAPGPGSQFNVLSGSYAVSERLPWTSRPVVVARGELLSGDQASMVKAGLAGEPVSVFGFIEPRGDGDTGFGATVYSPLGDDELSIDRFGAVEIRASPSWIDRWLANPALIAVSAVVGLLSGLSGLIALSHWLWHDGDKDEMVSDSAKTPPIAAPPPKPPRRPVRVRDDPNSPSPAARPPVS